MIKLHCQYYEYNYLKLQEAKNLVSGIEEQSVESVIPKSMMKKFNKVKDKLSAGSLKVLINQAEKELEKHKAKCPVCSLEIED